jgi:hypothetical protein
MIAFAGLCAPTLCVAKARPSAAQGWHVVKAKPDASPVTACMAAITTAEQKHGIPAGLLMAIGRLESGRPDRATGAVQPWPWTINAAGRGFYFESQVQAVAFVQDTQKNGTASIDTGCMQVNLQQHPNAFRTLEDAFDPRINADYAATFLADLHRETGDWGTASGFYHSRTPELAGPYQTAVAIRYPALAKSTFAAAPAPPTPMQIMATAWAATLPPASVQAVSAWVMTPPETHPQPRRRGRTAVLVSAR